jgi:glycosyltransferase involved in cell wall biosynthesis
MNKTVSLCVTCYDADYHLLDNLLNELKNQTVSPDELVISSSGIKTSKLLKTKRIKISGKNIPIITVNAEKTHFAGEARNNGSMSASMDLIQFFDVDDIPHISRTEITKKVFDSSEYDAMVHSYCDSKDASFSNSKLSFNKSLLWECFWGPDDSVAGGQLRTEQDRFMHPCLKPNNKFSKIAHGPITIKKEIIKKIKYTKDPRGEDCKFCKKVIDEGFRVGYYHSELMNYIV